MPSFSPRTQKHIIHACMALHNFFHDSKLHHEEFHRCDVDEEYLAHPSNAEAPTQGNDVPQGENEETMNTIRNAIADALFSTRGR
jgi:hypothetical protein